jgi:hypothetical protein
MTITLSGVSAVSQTAALAQGVAVVVKGVAATVEPRIRPSLRPIRVHALVRPTLEVRGTSLGFIGSVTSGAVGTLQKAA